MVEKRVGTTMQAPVMYAFFFTYDGILQRKITGLRYYISRVTEISELCLDWNDN